MLCWRKMCKLDLFIKSEIFSVLLGKGLLFIRLFFFFCYTIYYMISTDIICLMEVIFYAV